MSAAAMLAGAAPERTPDWHSIDWRKVWRTVRRLQARIVKAVAEGRWNKAKALVYLLTHSFGGRALAILRVVSNSGVSGRSKPASEGRLKTSHFEETQIRRLGFGANPLPQEPSHGESAQDGHQRDHPYTAPPRLVPAPHRRPNWGSTARPSPVTSDRLTRRQNQPMRPPARTAADGAPKPANAPPGSERDRRRARSDACDSRLDARSAASRQRSGQWL